MKSQIYSPMKNTVFIRPLVIEDAETSYKWRNNPSVWTYTGFRSVNKITREIEAEWLSNCLKRQDQYRFAICMKDTGQYIGNVQLINVEDKNAEFHLFIGEEEFWGRGIGKEASFLMLDYGFRQLGLKTITLTVHEDNIPAKVIYMKMGFKILSSSEPFLKMVLSETMFDLHFRVKNIEKTS